MWFKIIKSLFVLTFTSIFLFSLIYKYKYCKTWADAIYTSVMLQTLTGVQHQPENNTIKFAMTIQAIISYLITAHIIILSFRAVKC